MAALHLKVPDDRIKAALANFSGVKRRFEYIVRSDAHLYIDDYAHHPTELKAFLGAVRELYPERKLTVVFQPHLFTRTRDFMEGFAESLANSDTMILMEIYPAREKPIPGIDSSALLAKIATKDKYLLDNQGVLDFVAEHRPELLVTVGAGNIDQLVIPIKEVLSHG